MEEKQEVKIASPWVQYVNALDQYVLHTSDVKVENGIAFLPLYMTPLL